MKARRCKTRAVLTCDGGCGDTTSGNLSFKTATAQFAEAWQAAKARGWTKAGRGDKTRHYCAPCAARTACA